ncbi:MAG TPA: cobalamin-dependent protein, partial [Clostridia bacterium]|nr:cobalamin-dependent protein [Clostridia bacterium]
KEAVLEAVALNNARLAGLSALMTTTVPSMEATITQLHKCAPECRIMVGGAVLSEGYAKKIGADFYGKNAMAAVHYAQKVYSS